jgi:integrase
VSKEGGEPRTQGRRPGESDKTLPGILRPLLALPLEQIDADRVRVWLQDESAKRPTHTRLPLACCAPSSTGAPTAPSTATKRTRTPASRAWPATNCRRKSAKDDCLQREQLPAWFAAVRQIGNPVIAAYLQTALLTGARREEVAGIRWEDVDFQWKAMTIKDKVDGSARFR